MIDALVIGILALLGVVMAVWSARPRLRRHAEQPKYEMLGRIARFEGELPRREVVDPHRRSDKASS